jgi:hypothetical protein
MTITGSLVRFGEQKLRIDAKTFCDALDIIDRDVALASFHTAVIGAVHLDFVGEVLLADAALLSDAPEIGRQNATELAGMGAFHAA